MDAITLLQTNQSVFIGLSTLLGLLIGSFLNVVIYRFPVMMEREWDQQCYDYLSGKKEGGEAPNKPAEQAPFNLATPRSRCPSCQHAITLWENIPVLSYLLLRGKCSSCQTKISLRYPIIELVTALTTGVCAWHFGVGLAAGSAMVLTWTLIALTMIDFDHQLLPDDITLPVMWLGLLLGIFGVFCDTESSLIGAIAGYISLWSVYQLFKLTTGKEGMGYGDFKLLALLGAWLGWTMLLPIILISSIVGAVAGLSLILVLGRDKNVPIPFGPYLASAGWITLIWGEPVSVFLLPLFQVN